MTRSFRRRRSALYLPASNVKALAKVASLACDAAIFDLEDAVAPEAKAEARANLLAHFHVGAFGTGQERVIRANLSDGFVDSEDLALVLRSAPHALLIPKVETAEQLRHTRKALDAGGGHDIRLWAMIETPRAIVGLRDIVEGAARHDVGLDCLVAGTNDLSKETGVPLPLGRRTIEHWLALIVIHAKAGGIDVLDGVYNDFNDEVGFMQACRDGALSGFDGKTLIHPRQIAPANAAFAPSAEAIAEARTIVQAFADPANSGKGVISIEGKMTELLHLEMARRTLAKLN
jgi:citrate lyase subunit beta/citryl-CoA lyase